MGWKLTDAIRRAATRTVEAIIKELLREVFGLRVQVKVQWEPLEGRWRKGWWGETEVEGGKRVICRVAINPRCIGEDALLKATAVHEALHIAYRLLMPSRPDRFWDALARALPACLSILSTTYEKEEEFVVSVLEPLLTLWFKPSPRTFHQPWEITLTEGG